MHTTNNLALLASTLLTLTSALPAAQPQGSSTSTSATVSVDWSPSIALCYDADPAAAPINYKSCLKVFQHMVAPDPVWTQIQQSHQWITAGASFFKIWELVGESCAIRLGTTNSHKGYFTEKQVEIGEFEVERQCPGKGGRIFLNTEKEPMGAQEGWYVEAIDKSGLDKAWKLAPSTVDAVAAVNPNAAHDIRRV